jgi:HEAT repeat protein
VLARRRILGLTALLSALSMACPAAAQQATRAQVEHDLAGFEQGPDDAAVRAWGADAPALLMTIGNDPAAPPHVRQRAVFALRHFAPRPAVRDYLRALTAVPEQGLYVLRAALDALVMGGGDVATAAGFLDDARVEVRDGAAWALARTSLPAARTALTARLRVERDETVRRTIADALAASAATRAVH